MLATDGKVSSVIGSDFSTYPLEKAVHRAEVCTHNCCSPGSEAHGYGE